MTAFEVPTLTTDRLRLQAFRAGDLDAFAAMRATPEVTRYLGTGRTSTRAETWRMMATFLGQWALLGYGVWACEKIVDRAFVGSVGVFHPPDWPEPEIIYALGRPYWHHGYATEAAGAARDWLFERFPILQAASFIKPDNYPSKRVAERLGRSTRAHSRLAAPPMSIGCTGGWLTAPERRPYRIRGPVGRRNFPARLRMSELRGAVVYHIPWPCPRSPRS